MLKPFGKCLCPMSGFSTNGKYVVHENDDFLAVSVCDGEARVHMSNRPHETEYLSGAHGPWDCIYELQNIGQPSGSTSATAENVKLDLRGGSSRLPDSAIIIFASANGTVRTAKHPAAFARSQSQRGRCSPLGPYPVLRHGYSQIARSDCREQHAFCGEALGCSEMCRLHSCSYAFASNHFHAGSCLALPLSMSDACGGSTRREKSILVISSRWKTS